MRDWSNGAAGVSSTRTSPNTDSREAPFVPAGAPSAQLGSVRIARRVLRTVVEQAALAVRGVARMARARGGLQQVVGRSLPQHGVSLVLRGDVVAIDLHLIVAPGASMVEVGTQVQEAVGAAVEHILGMKVSEINVYIQDVA
ncbi:MAG TPA: Asp23/Gls24 family envelope stress response protein [Ktedonobacterales bacterium]|nr:Asp23/Gls24 family envelope stress response protein [Ktedonobacterales bacterium]